MTALAAGNKKRRKKRARLWSLSRERPWVFYTVFAALIAAPVLLAVWLSRWGVQPTSAETLAPSAANKTGESTPVGGSGDVDVPFVPTKEKAVAPDDGFVALINGKDLTGWHVEGENPRQWSVEGGVVVAKCPSWKTRNYLLSIKDYSDFILRFQFMLDPGSGGGVALRAIEQEKVPYLGSTFFDHPLVKLTDRVKFPKEPTGTLSWVKNNRAFSDVPEAVQLSTGEWHTMEIKVYGDTCSVALAGKALVVVRLQSGDYGGFRPALKRNKGKIGFQAHTGTLRLRRVEIKKLGSVPPSPAAPLAPPALFNGHDLSGWERIGGGTWTVADGILRGQDSGTGPGWLASERDYGNFELDLEYRLSPKGNSGVFVHAWKDAPLNGGKFLEIQLIDDQGYNTFGKVNGTAALFGVLAPTPSVRSIPGVWHKLGVRALGRRVQVSVGARPVLDTNLDSHAAFFSRFPGLQKTTGRIGLQQNGGTVEFRNMQLRVLP